MKRLLCLAALMLAGCQPGPVDETVANTATEQNAAPADANVAAPASANVAAPAEPEPARIPANFHGLWAENESACGELTHPSRLTVTGNSVRFPKFVLAVEAVTQPTPASFAVKGFSKQTKAPTEAHYSIDQTGNLLTDEAGGGAVRVRCT